MADHQLGAGEISVHEVTLAAGVIDWVYFPTRVEHVEVISDGADNLYVSYDGSDPVVAGPKTLRLPGGFPSTRRINIPGSGVTEIGLISEGAVTYSVSELIGET